jgi:protocatechuate 3,4-dioxygenase beta subunit
VTIVAGGTVSGLQFGDFQNITLSGQVFDDLDGSGVQNPGDPGLQGWTIDLFNSAGTLVGTTTTDANGNYSFGNLGPGTYTVQEELQPGWILTFPAPPGTWVVAATSGTDAPGLNFGDYELVTYSGTVFNDLNGSGSYQMGDPGLAGWTVELIQNGNVIATTTSAADGSYSFSGITAGNYLIEEVNQAGWYQTDPVDPPGWYSLTANSGSSMSGLNFGNFALVNVTGNVYNDTNGNGKLDPGEPPLQGWTINLTNPAGNLVATTTSDAKGNYAFDGLFPGTFTVSEVLQAGWTQTQPTNPAGYTFATQSGTNETLNFGNFKNVSISGYVYNDLNGDGKLEANEPGLGGWTVELLNSSGQVVGTTTTLNSGAYTFANLGPVGATRLVQVVQPNWVYTQPNILGYYNITLTSGKNLVAKFGDHVSPALTPTAAIANGQAGYHETGTWATVGGGYTNTSRKSATVSGPPTATATWDFTGIPNGSYEVWVTYTVIPGNATNAPFTVYDGGTSLGTTPLDESIRVTQAHGAMAQGSYGGWGWLELGTFTITSGDLKVVLTNQANNSNVIANGVLIIDPPANQNVTTNALASGANAMGALDLSQIAGGNNSSNSSNNNSRSNPTVVISGVTQPIAVNVSYGTTLPAQGPATTTAVDLAIRDSGNSGSNGSADVLTAVAEDLVSTKKNRG